MQHDARNEARLGALPSYAVRFRRHAESLPYNDLSVLAACRLDVAPLARRPVFCSGCPHNRSTKLPNGSFGVAGIGCHGLVQFMDRNPLPCTHMGAEGVNWIGLSHFSETKHVFVNLGDGTFSHSGSLAIRAAAASDANVTFKILANDVVAMTGGQTVESGLSIGAMVRQVLLEGAKRVVVVAEHPEALRSSQSLPPQVKLVHRTQMENVQRELREIPGTTVIVYVQICATEKRKRRKRGKVPAAAKRVVINPAVCEGCGDCSSASNCMSVQPLETEFGRKRRIDQASCKMAMAPAPVRTLQERISVRSAALRAYQDTAYAERFRSLVERVQEAEERASPGSRRLTEAVATNAFRLMAYKDEYEVARLLTDAYFWRGLRRRFSRGSLKLHLAPPMLSGRGRPRKMAFSATLLLPALRLLTRFKWLRGTAFDPFGWTRERKTERRLRDEYLGTVGDIAGALDSSNLDAAIALASYPQEIRGYGPVKEASIARVEPKAKELKCRFAERSRSHLTSAA